MAGIEVFCQMLGGMIMGGVCAEEQGQKGCRGCNASTRLCKKCKLQSVANPDSGLCAGCGTEGDITVRAERPEKRSRFSAVDADDLHRRIQMFRERYPEPEEIPESELPITKKKPVTRITPAAQREPLAQEPRVRRKRALPGPAGTKPLDTETFQTYLMAVAHEYRVTDMSIFFLSRTRAKEVTLPRKVLVYILKEAGFIQNHIRRCMKYTGESSVYIAYQNVLELISLGDTSIERHAANIRRSVNKSRAE